MSATSQEVTSAVAATTTASPSTAIPTESAAFWPTVSEAETSRSPIAPGPARRSAVLFLLVVLDPDPLGGQPCLDPVEGALRLVAVVHDLVEVVVQPRQQHADVIGVHPARGLQPCL